MLLEKRHDLSPMNLQCVLTPLDLIPMSPDPGCNLNDKNMKKKVVYVTAMPTPYREAIHERVSRSLDGDYHVVYCNMQEPNRLWKVEPAKYSKSFLKKSFFKLVYNIGAEKTSKASRRVRDKVFVHVNFDVWPELNRLDPQIVITTGFNPTFLFAVVWCAIKRRKHISFTDGWLKSEEHLTFIHTFIRRLVFRWSSAFLGASRHSLELFRHYGCPERAIFQSHLCANNDYYKGFIGSDKKYDIVFSGQFIERKMPLFFAEVAILLKSMKPDLRVLLLGDGADRQKFIDALQNGGVDFDYKGYVSQVDLPAHYASAKIFLFPTEMDPWGVVANEACAVGVPVITCSNAGVANDLILNGYNGFVLTLDANLWAEHVMRLLGDNSLWNRFSRNALQKVQEYNYDAAAEGIMKAIKFCGFSAGYSNSAISQEIDAADFHSRERI